MSPRVVLVLVLILAACGSTGDDVSLGCSGLASETDMNTLVEAQNDEPSLKLVSDEEVTGDDAAVSQAVSFRTCRWFRTGATNPLDENQEVSVAVIEPITTPSEWIATSGLVTEGSLASVVGDVVLVVRSDDSEDRAELTRLISRSLGQEGDPGAASTETDSVESFFNFAATQVGPGSQFMNNARSFVVAERLGVPIPGPTDPDEAVRDWMAQVTLATGAFPIGVVQNELILLRGADDIRAAYAIELRELVASVSGGRSSLYLDTGPRWEDRLASRGWVETGASWQSNDSTYSVTIDGGGAMFRGNDVDRPDVVVADLRDSDLVLDALISSDAYAFAVFTASLDEVPSPATLPPAHVTGYGVYFDESEGFVTVLVVGYASPVEATEAASLLTQLITEPEADWAADGEIETDGSLVLIELPSGTEADCIAGNDACNPRRWNKIAIQFSLYSLLDS